MAEKRLIDANAILYDFLKRYTEMERDGNLVFAACEIKQDFADMISNAETVDAVEVLRCKYCKHYHAVIANEKTGEVGDLGICDQPWRNEGYDVNETDYCSSAEPK